LQQLRVEIKSLALSNMWKPRMRMKKSWWYRR